MGTSQPAIARIESAQENITLDTLHRFIVALKGRFRVEICPQEYPVKQQVNWWELPPAPVEPGWTVVRTAYSSYGDTQQALVGLERHKQFEAGTSTALTALLPAGKTN